MIFKCVINVQDLISKILIVVIVQNHSFLLNKEMKEMTVTNANPKNVLQTDLSALVANAAPIRVHFAEVCGK